MLYRILADLVLVLHLCYVLFVVVGLVAIVTGGVMHWRWVRSRWFRGIHLIAILVVVLEAWVGITCPLTLWEKSLRLAAGQNPSQGDFIANWVHEALFFDLPSWVFTLGYTLVAAFVLATLLLVPPAWKAENHETPV